MCSGSGSRSRCSVSGCSQPSEVDFDCATLLGYSTLHAGYKTQLYSMLIYYKL